MESYRIDPAKPPLPTDWYRPDQPEGGSHTSNLMFESCVGRISPVTRQKAAGIGVGRMNPRAHSGTGGVKAPAATDSAKVIVVFGKFTCDRSAQFAAAEGLAPHASDVNATSAGKNLNRFLVTTFPVLLNRPATQSIRSIWSLMSEVRTLPGTPLTTGPNANVIANTNNSHLWKSNEY